MSDRSDPSATMYHKTTSGNVKDSKLINSGRDTNYNVHNYNMGVFHDVIEFFRIVAHLFVAWTRSAGGKERDDVEISSIIPPDPSLLDVTSIEDLYTRSMLRCRVGYSLYEPDPFSQFSKEYSRNGVNVGDVGFIREEGTFDFLFNICPPQNNFINPPNLPDGFSLESPEHSETRTMKPLPHATRFFPPTVIRTISGEYISEGSEGAILELPEGAIGAGAINTGWFADLAKRRGVEWYKYTKTLGRDISNGSLYLVPSFTKCSQWGIAVVDRPCDLGQGLTFVSSPLGWKSSGGSVTKVADTNQGDTQNQCIFLRGYKIMIRQDIFDNLPTRQRATRIRGGGETGFSSRIKELLIGESSLTRTTTKSADVVLHADFNSPPVHPSDLINAALLYQNPEAKVALIHDDVWCDLLQNNFPNLKYPELKNSARSYTSTIDEHGSISLEKSTEIPPHCQASDVALRLMPDQLSGAQDQPTPEVPALTIQDASDSPAPVISALIKGEDVQVHVLPSPGMLSGDVPMTPHWDFFDQKLLGYPLAENLLGPPEDSEMTDITDPRGLSHFPFDGNEDSQSGNKDDIRTVGSPLVQQASSSRRKKDGRYPCPVDNCRSTFTVPHNLHYHLNSHWGLKPYKCAECSFATAYPTSLRKHIQKRHS